MVNDHYTESLRVGRQFLTWALFIKCLSLIELLPLSYGEGMALFLRCTYFIELYFIAFGIYKIGQYYQMTLPKRLLYTFVSALPFVGVLIVMLMEKKSSKSLKKEGYKVSLFGASQPISS